MGVGISLHRFCLGNDDPESVSPEMLRRELLWHNDQHPVLGSFKSESFTSSGGVDFVIALRKSVPDAYTGPPQ